MQCDQCTLTVLTIVSDKDQAAGAGCWVPSKWKSTRVLPVPVLQYCVVPSSVIELLLDLTVDMAEEFNVAHCGLRAVFG